MKDDFVGRWYPTEPSVVKDDDLWAGGVSDTTRCYERQATSGRAVYPTQPSIMERRALYLAGGWYQSRSSIWRKWGRIGTWHLAPGIAQYHPER